MTFSLSKIMCVSQSRCCHPFGFLRIFLPSETLGGRSIHPLIVCIQSCAMKKKKFFVWYPIQDQSRWNQKSLFSSYCELQCALDMVWSLAGRLAIRLRHSKNIHPSLNFLQIYFGLKKKNTFPWESKFSIFQKRQTRMIDLFNRVQYI